MKNLKNKKGHAPLEVSRPKAAAAASQKKSGPLTGQVMVLSVVMLGGVLLGASAIAGLLMVYQIRQANDAVNSAKAIFAADAEIERQSYILIRSIEMPPLSFTNDASAISTVSNVGGRQIIRAQGFAGRVVRALEATFE